MVEPVVKSVEVGCGAAQARRDGYASGWVHVFEECFGGACR